MARKHVYGKKQTTASLATGCFFSDSPVRHEVEEDQSTNPASTHGQVLDNDIASLVENLKCVTVTESPLRRSPRLQKKQRPQKIGDGILTPRSVNVDSANGCFSINCINLMLSPKRHRKAPSLFSPRSAARSPALKTRLRQSLIDESSFQSTPEFANVVELCENPESFEQWTDSLCRYFEVLKIAEASYGEVYRLTLKNDSSQFSKADESVLKIIALRPRSLGNNSACSDPSIMTAAERRLEARIQKRMSAMSAAEDVASEVRLLQRMSTVPGFTNFRDVKVVQGRPPKPFVQAWRTFNKEVKKSLFPDPSRRANYSEDQLWAVIEMQDAGTDLENLIERRESLQHIEPTAFVWDVFWNVACALAKGEEWANFEHRDLHLGNICIRLRDQSLERTKDKLGHTGVETTIIDYTLSRAVMLDDDIAYFDLSKDPAVFEGDGEDDYQYDLYRHMRAAVLNGDPALLATQPDVRKTRRGKHDDLQIFHEDDTTTRYGDWKDYHPITNLVWLHFILVKLLNFLLPGNPALLPDSEEADELSKALSRLQLQESQPPNVLARLKCLKSMLALEGLARSELHCSADLVGWAMAEGWLGEDCVLQAGL